MVPPVDGWAQPDLPDPQTVPPRVPMGLCTTVSLKRELLELGTDESKAWSRAVGEPPKVTEIGRQTSPRL